MDDRKKYNDSLDELNFDEIEDLSELDDSDSEDNELLRKINEYAKEDKYD